MSQREIELQAIKKINLTEFLASMGFYSVRVSNGKAWYLSPLRKETTPSFVVYINKEPQDWYDYGICKGGSIIDFVMEFFQMDYVEAVRNLRKEAKARGLL